MYLNCHSYHSLRYGTIPIDDLVDQAKACGVRAMALTDINTVSGIYDFYKACLRAQIKALVGMEIRLNNRFLYIAIAKNAQGVAEMCKLLSDHNLKHAPLSARAPRFNNVMVIYRLSNAPEQLQSNEYIGVSHHELTLLYRDRWKKMMSKMVVLQAVSIRGKKEFNLHKILRAIQHNTLLSKLQEHDIARSDEIMLPMPQLLQAFSGFPMLLKNTEQFIEACNFEFDFSQSRNKKFYTTDAYTDKLLLEQLAMQGLKQRYGKNHAEAKARVIKELDVIDRLQFSAYFLINWDIIRYSNSCGFMHVGRGSGANSIVSYCLGITDICPIELNLYFERFLNAHRKSPPDFDIDWSWKDRDTILSYIFKRYGADHVAFCGTNVEFKYRSIFREVGKVFGLAKEELDVLAKTPMAKHDTNSMVKLVQEYGILLEKYPNQRSMHSCGIIISEDPLHHYTALELPPKGFPIIQFDMHVAEEIGFDKFDILSQRGLGTIDTAVQLIEKNRGIKVDIRNVNLSKDEALCNEWLSKGKTLGCFYIESPAMRGLLRRLKCSNYKVLVAASSIIRPGVAKSGMMREYVFRHNHPERFEYFHEVFQEHLGETYGIMVYQEDVIKIALHFAGLEASYGDILRRAISGKTRSVKELDAVKAQFFLSCEKKGHPPVLSQEVYRQIESFAGYSFCKAHSASYAVESYQSLYLKVYYGVEFMVAAINNGGGFYRSEIYVHEARMAGANIHNPCVNNSMYETSVCGNEVYLGFMHMKSLNTDNALLIVQEREARGNYVSLDDFIQRLPIGIEALQLLIYIGAFRFTGMAKNELIIQARLLHYTQAGNSYKPCLFHEAPKQYTLPKLERLAFEDAFDEIEILGFPTSCSPFDLLQTSYRGDVLAADLVKFHKKQVKMLAYLVSTKQVPTKAGTMYFGTWIDADGAYFDTAHFPASLLANPFQGGGCYLLQGVVEVDFHFPTIAIQKMAKLPFVPDPRYEASSGKQFVVQQQLKADESLTHRAPYPQAHEIGLPRYKMKI